MFLFLTLKMVAGGSSERLVTISERLVTIYQTTQCNIPTQASVPHKLG
jgi:hypothetical protein